MKIRESIVKNLGTYLDGKKILEVACGDSEFSLSASKYAKEVLATDISLERFKRRNLDGVPQNIEFKEMNATTLLVDNDSIDITVCYNALGHLENILQSVLIEMIRVTMQEGYLLFMATWTMDKKIISKLKDMISEYSNLEVCDDIEKSTFRALIVKKIRT